MTKCRRVYDLRRDIIDGYTFKLIYKGKIIKCDYCELFDYFSSLKVKSVIRNDVSMCYRIEVE